MNAGTNPNRVQVLTAPGAAALSVVRVSGPALHPFLEARFSKPLQVGRATHGELVDAGGQVIDDPVVALLPDGSAEICLHGGPWVLQATLDCLESHEFEVVHHSSEKQGSGSPIVEQFKSVEELVLRMLPLATTELGLRAVLSQVDAWTQFDRRHGVDPLAILLDQTEPIASPAMAQELATIRSDRALHWLLHPPTVAIVGPANAGKSTLANTLLGRERSIVADLPGTTRDWVGETADLNGLPILLIDTPGIRESEDAIEATAIEVAVGRVQLADLIVVVLDATRPLEPEQQPLLDQFPGAMRVVNKCDCPAVLDLRSLDGLHVSAKLNAGIDELIVAIQTHFGIANLDLNTPRLLR